MTKQGVKFCPTCGHNDELEKVWPSSGGGHTETWKCKHCGEVWHHQRAGTRPGVGLKEKYTVLKGDGEPMEGPSFVLVLTDDAAKAALRAYAMATLNSDLASDIRNILADMSRHPDRYPDAGDEGRLNAGVKYRAFEQGTAGSIFIMKPGFEED